MTGPEFEDDASSRYLRRMQGQDQRGSTGQTPPPAAPPLRDARSGRLIGGGPQKIPVPSAPDPLTALQTPYQAPPGEDALPPGAPRATAPPPPVPGLPTAQPGQLPPWFRGEGLSLLRAMQYPRAAEFYRGVAQKNSDQAEGWLGIGAAMFGANDLKNAATYLGKGHDLDPAFPIGALVAEARPGDPRLLYELACVFARQNSRSALVCAIMVLEECQASPLLSEKMYLKAEAVKRKAREAMELIDAQSNPAVLHMKKNARRNRNLSGLIKLAFVVVILGALGLVAWMFQRHTEAQALLTQGTVDYVAAWKAANRGQGGDPVAMFDTAYGELRQAVSLDGSLFQGQFMLNRAAQVLLQYAAEGRAKKLSAERLQDVSRAAADTRSWLKQANPKGDRVRAADNDLRIRLDEK